MLCAKACEVLIIRISKQASLDRIVWLYNMGGQGSKRPSFFLEFLWCDLMVSEPVEYNQLIRLSASAGHSSISSLAVKTIVLTQSELFFAFHLLSTQIHMCTTTFIPRKVRIWTQILHTDIFNTDKIGALGLAPVCCLSPSSRCALPPILYLAYFWVESP